MEPWTRDQNLSWWDGTGSKSWPGLPAGVFGVGGEGRYEKRATLTYWWTGKEVPRYISPGAFGVIKLTRTVTYITRIVKIITLNKANATLVFRTVSYHWLYKNLIYGDKFYSDAEVWVPRNSSTMWQAGRDAPLDMSPSRQAKLVSGFQPTPCVHRNNSLNCGCFIVRSPSFSQQANSRLTETVYMHTETI